MFGYFRINLFLLGLVALPLCASLQASDSDVREEIIDKSSYKYSDIYKMIEISEDRQIEFTNKTSGTIKLITWEAPYSYVQKVQEMHNTMSLASDAVSSISVKKDQRIKTTLSSGDSISFTSPDDDTVISIITSLNEQAFYIQFFKDTKVPLFSIRSAFGFYKKEHGWVVSAKEIK